MDAEKYPPQKRAGWRREDEESEGCEEYLIAQDVWPALCKEMGLDPRSTAQLLTDKGFLKGGDGRHLAGKYVLPVVRRIRAYCITGRIFDAGDEAPQRRR